MNLTHSLEGVTLIAASECWTKNKTIPIYTKNKKEMLLRYIPSRSNTPVPNVVANICFSRSGIRRTLRDLPVLVGECARIYPTRIHLSDNQYYVDYGLLFNIPDKRLLFAITEDVGDDMMRTFKYTIYIDSQLLTPKHKKVYNGIKKKLISPEVLVSYIPCVRIVYLQNLEYSLFSGVKYDTFAKPSITEERKQALLNCYV